MASETLEEKASPRVDGSPAREVTDQEHEVEEDVEEEEEEEEGEKEGVDEGAEEVEAEAGGKRKRGRRKAGEVTAGKEEEVGTPTKRVRKRRSVSMERATPVDRPSRERKTVERYSALSPRKAGTPKKIPVKQGSGTKLKDIPNVFFKLSKRKGDEGLQDLHKILFGKRAKARILKKNIFEFSGFAWTDNEEKERTKLREKLDRCVKDKLLDFCDVLDLPSRAGLKKEDILTSLLEFLQSPHATRDLILKEKEQSGKKRKRRGGAVETASGEKQRRRHKHSDKADNEENQEKEGEDEEEIGNEDDKGGPSDEDDIEHSDLGKSEKEEVKDVEPEPVLEQKSSVKKQTKKGGKSVASAESKPVKKDSVESERKETTPKEKKKGGSSASSVEKSSPVKKGNRSKSQKDQDLAMMEKKSSRKQATETKPSSRASRKENGKGKASRKSIISPTKEEMHAVVGDILKEVDFNTATLADILRQLGAYFGTDLMHRKAEVKSIIEEVISNMTDDESDEEEEGDDETAPQKEGDAEKSREGKGDAEESPEEGDDVKENRETKVDAEATPEDEDDDKEEDDKA